MAYILSHAIAILVALGFAAGPPRRRPVVLSENSIRLGIRIVRQNRRMIGGDACNPALTRNVHRRLVQVTVPA
jgi:hypothetical protein